MAGREKIGQSLIFKIATAAIIILIIGGVYIIQRALRQTGGAAVTYVKPAQEGIVETTKLPLPKEPELNQPPPAPETHPKLEVTHPRVTIQPTLPRLPATPSPPPALAARVQQLQDPVTEVHPLSDAEEVMGAASSEVGEVGATKTFKMPDNNGESKTLPPPNK